MVSVSWKTIGSRLLNLICKCYILARKIYSIPIVIKMQPLKACKTENTADLVVLLFALIRLIKMLCHYKDQLFDFCISTLQETVL